MRPDGEKKSYKHDFTNASFPGYRAVYGGHKSVKTFKKLLESCITYLMF